MAKRYVRNVPATIAAGANSGRVLLSTFDDDKVRKLTGFFIANPTALCHTQIDVSGVVIADIEHGDFTTEPVWHDLDTTYVVGVQIAFTVFNASAGAMTSPHDVLMFRYEV